MTRAILFSLLMSAAALGCAGDQELIDEAGDPSGLTVAGSTFFVFDNGTVCVTAPCPRFTAITPGAVTFDVSRVVLELGAREARPLLTSGGVVVEGRLIAGTWEPGGAGTVLRVRRPIEPARTYLAARHAAGAASPYAVVGPREANHEVDTLDLADYVPADLGVDQTLTTLTTGQWATRGFVATSDMGEVVLFASKGAVATRTLEVAPTGVQCVTQPCPVWSIAVDGVPVGDASDLDLTYMHLTATDESKVRDLFRKAGGTVQGWLAPGSWMPGGAGDVLLVVRVQQ